MLPDIPILFGKRIIKHGNSKANNISLANKIMGSKEWSVNKYVVTTPNIMGTILSEFSKRSYNIVGIHGISNIFEYERTVNGTSRRYAVYRFDIENPERITITNYRGQLTPNKHARASNSNFNSKYLNNEQR